MSAEDLRFMFQVVMLGLASMVVDVAGIVILAWHHDTQSILPMTFALFLVLGSTVTLAYRLGRWTSAS